MLLIGGWNAGPLICDLQNHLITLTTNGNFYLAISIGIFDGIPDDIVENLSNPNWVCAQCRQGLDNLRVHFEALGLDLPLQHIECVMQNTFQLHKFPLRIQACFNTAQVKQTIDQAGNMLNTDSKTVHEITLLLIERTNALH